MRVSLEVDLVIDPQYGDIVVQGTGVKFWMHVDTSHVPFDVRVELDVMVHVPFTESNAEITGRVHFHAMSRREDVLRRDERATANVNTLRRVLLQDRHLPWIFTEFRITVDVRGSFDASVDTLRVPDSALSRSRFRRRLSSGTAHQTGAANSERRSGEELSPFSVRLLRIVVLRSSLGSLVRAGTGNGRRFRVLRCAHDLR